MLFHTQAFLLAFLPLTLAAYYALAGSAAWRRWTMIAASLVFYGYWDWRLIPLLVGSVVANWLLSMLPPRLPLRAVVVLGVAANLLLLGVFKYVDFAAASVEALLGLRHDPFGIVLPLGISFFTFQQISYLVDLGRGEAPRYRFADYALWVVLFPHLIAGPIIRHHEIIEQFKLEPRRPGLAERVTENGEGYQKARQAFGVLLGNYGTSMFMASRNIGGLYVNRDHKGDPGARAPFVVVPADKQREALALLEEYVLSDKPFQFPPELYNHLAASRWNHWGVNDVPRIDYKIHEVISMWQERMLSQVLSSLTLTRLHDSELKISADQDAFTTAELLERLTKSIFSEVGAVNPEVQFTNRKPAISSLRRNLQRNYLQRMAQMAMTGSGAPDDCQTIAFAELSALETRINDLLKGPAKLDSYTRAHLTESSSRIHKVLDARLTLAAP